MNKIYTLEQISKTGNFDAILIVRQYEQKSMSRFLGTKSNIPELGEKI